MNLSEILLIANPALIASSGLDRAIALAKVSGASLYICLFDFDRSIEAAGDLVSPEVRALALEQFRVRKLQALTAQAATATNSGIHVEYEFIWAPHPVEAILKKICELAPDLVIKDLHHDSAVARLFRAPIDNRLARLTPCPLMFVQPSTISLPKRIAAALDMTADSGKFTFNAHIVDAASEIAKRSDAELNVVSVDVPFIPTIPEHAAVYEAYFRQHAEFRKRFQTQLASAGVASEYVHILEGAADAKLVSFAAHADVDLMVLGSSHHDQLDRFMLGSTSESVLQKLGCDVLLIKPAEFQAQLRAELGARFGKSA